MRLLRLPAKLQVVELQRVSRMLGINQTSVLRRMERNLLRMVGDWHMPRLLGPLLLLGQEV